MHQDVRNPLLYYACFRVSTTALSLAPCTAWEFGELDAQFVEFAPRPLGMALPCQGIPLLRPPDLRRRPSQTFPWGSLAQPPGRDAGGDRIVHLALRQLRVFPPRTPAASVPGTGS